MKISDSRAGSGERSRAAEKAPIWIITACSSARMK